MEVAVEPPEQLNRAKRFKNKLLYNRTTAYANTKLFDLINGNESTTSRKTRLITIGALGSVAALTTGLEFGHKIGLPRFGDNLTPENYLVHSGRHFLVGWLGAALVKGRGKWDNWKGWMGGAIGANFAIEGLQAVIVTGIIHRGPLNIWTMFKPGQWRDIGLHNNGDLMAAGAGGLIHTGQVAIAHERSRRTV